MAFTTLLFTFVLASSLSLHSFADNFYTNYKPLWGYNHILVNPQATEVQLVMDQSSGAGFRSKAEYGYGEFRISMKIPEKRTGGLVPNFYLTSAPDNQDPGNHYEIDFEFLGTTGIVQTNIYDNDQGHREQSFKLPFDPSQHFHTYEIMWNPHLILFRVDGVAIRVFKNLLNLGVPYPNLKMHVEASLWAADWAGQVDWSLAPFTSHYKNFQLWACKAQGESIQECGAKGHLWNKQKSLSHDERQQIAAYKNRFLVYDYCAHPSTRKPECEFNY